MPLSVSVSAVNCKLVCIELKSWRIACMLVWLGSYGITQLPTAEREAYRKLVVKCIETLQQENKTNPENNHTHTQKLK